MNKQLLLDKRPVGLPSADTWKLVETDIPEISDGQILVRNHYVSLDPAMRGWMNDVPSYIPPVKLGEVMRAGTVGEVLESKHDHFKPGDFVSGTGGVQEYVASDARGWVKVNPDHAPLPAFIGTLGMPGFTAYFGLLEIGELKQGDQVLVSGAAGAVGSIVGQIAKTKGCHVVGIAGGPEKCAYIKDTLGYDGAIDYKNEHVQSAIKRECPKGVDVYFDNVGGDILDAALTKINLHARIVICGAISQYNNTTDIQGPKNYLSLLVNRATMRGMVVFDHSKRYGEAAQQLGQWMAEGKIISKEDIYEGIENFASTFERLFSGDKLGKLVLKII